MIKIETHCHSFGTSACATTDNSTLIAKYAAAGYKGIILNNHFSRGCYDAYLKGKGHEKKINAFFRFYDEFKKDCERCGIRVFEGAEIRVRDPRTESGTEYSVIGFERRVFYDNPPLFEYSQKELFNLAENEGAFMYQTHPFRTNVFLGNPDYMHGAESFNGHYHHVNSNDKAKRFCEENDLIGMSGTDFHHEDQPITAGMFLPEEITTEKELVAYIFENKFKNIVKRNEYLTALKKYRNG